MAKRILHTLFVVPLAFLLGCQGEPPTQVSEDREEVLAEIIAGAAGYESSGLTAALSDVVSANDRYAAGERGGVMPAIGSSITYSDSSFDPRSRSEMLTVARRRDASALAAGSRLLYRIRYAIDDVPPVAAAFPGRSPMRAEAHAEGIFATSRLRIQGESHGHLRFVDNAGGSVGVAGSYNCHGSSTLSTTGEEYYRDISIGFEWDRLAIGGTRSDECRPMEGRATVTVEANGPDGRITRTGVLIFGRSNRALLVLGGKRFVLDLRAARYIGKG